MWEEKEADSVLGQVWLDEFEADKQVEQWLASIKRDDETGYDETVFRPLEMECSRKPLEPELIPAMCSDIAECIPDNEPCLKAETDEYTPNNEPCLTTETGESIPDNEPCLKAETYESTPDNEPCLKAEPAPCTIDKPTCARRARKQKAHNEKTLFDVEQLLQSRRAAVADAAAAKAKVLRHLDQMTAALAPPVTAMDVGIPKPFDERLQRIGAGLMEAFNAHRAFQIYLDAKDEVLRSIPASEAKPKKTRKKPGPEKALAAAYNRYLSSLRGQKPNIRDFTRTYRNLCGPGETMEQLALRTRRMIDRSRKAQQRRKSG